MSKILYVDTGIDGHHLAYMKELFNIREHECIAFLPELIENKNINLTIAEIYDCKSYNSYKKWISRVKDIAKQENVDLIHFLYGDIFYRFFGMGLFSLRKYKIIVTFHHLRYGKLHDVSLKRIFKHLNIGIVHTDTLKSELYKRKIENIIKIEYPVFERTYMLSNQEIKMEKDWCLISNNKKVLLYIGGTRFDKGLDILLEALQNVQVPFHLMIAGQELSFKRAFIENQIATYQDSVTIDLAYLTDEEMNLYFNLADYVVLPYRKIFDGASGPLGQAVLYHKVIIGPNHGSLGSIISEHQLGYTFQAENVDSLCKCLSDALENEFVFKDEYKNYQSELSPQIFRDEYEKLYSNLSEPIQ